MQGDIIVELDGDDWLARPDALSLIDAAYRADPHVEATAGGHEVVPGGHIAIACTQPARGFRLMQNGFASSVPAPRTWLRRLTSESLAAWPNLYTDPQTGLPWRTNADMAMFAPALLFAERIASIDEVLVNVDYHEGRAHDWTEARAAQRDEGERLFSILVETEWRKNEHLLRPFIQNQRPSPS